MSTSKSARSSCGDAGHGPYGGAATKTLALVRQAKNLLMAYMPYKVHVHNVALDLVQPWTHGYWRHPFMRDIWRFVEVEPAAGAS